MSPDAPELTRRCATNEYHRSLLDTDPAYKPTRQSLEQFNDLYRRNQTLRSGVALIPVVFHVVYNRDAANITETQVDSQIAALNADFNAQNADINQIPAAFKPLLGEARIRFFRVQRDPQGKQHPGITRTRTRIQAFNQSGTQLDQRMKSSAQGGHDAWPSDRYLNIWVCDLGRNLLGYAQFPGGPIETDGVVINHTAFGTTGTSVLPFNLGRTTTHEVAHWLNVYHIWGDDGLACSGSDYCDDTPNQAGSNLGRPQFPHVSCGNGQSGDMFMNYMDYTDDMAMFMFTKGQVARMNATLTGPRSSLIGSNFQEPILQTGTRLSETDGTFDFLVADWNGDGVQDLIAIKKQNTASKTTELHILSGGSNFQQYLLQTDTILPETDGTFEFAMTDWNGDKSLDLVAIKKNGTDTGQTEVHILSGKAQYKAFLLQTRTALPPTDSTFKFLMGDWNNDGRDDLIAVRKSNTGSHSVEVHILSAATKFQTYILQTGTALHEVDDSFDFILTDWNGDRCLDLVAIKKRGGETSSTEVHILSGALNFRNYMLQTGTTLHPTDDRFAFQVAPRRSNDRSDLFVIKKRGTGTNTTEVHILAG
jgi:hypothetical protein